MQISSVYQLIASFIEIVVDDPSVTVIYANGNAPRPEKPFITLEINSLRDLAMPFRYEIDDTGVQKVCNSMAFNAVFNAYADGMHESEDMLNKVQRHFGTEIAYLHFQGDIAYMETVFGVSAIPQVEGAITESRSTMECTFNLNQMITDNVGLIETVEITDELTGIILEINK